MNEFVAIDFETGNPQRVSACAIGFAVVEKGEIINSGSYLMKPVGGHALFQTRIHGITENDTINEPMFDAVYPKIKNLLKKNIIGHSNFDKQVLNALKEYFNIKLDFVYHDSSSIAREKIPGLKNYRLDTVATHLCLPRFKHHDAKDDALACANIILKLMDVKIDNQKSINIDTKNEYHGLIKGIMADDQINYKEAYSLLYWLEDHPEAAKEYFTIFGALKNFCSDGCIDNSEENILKRMLSIEIERLR